MLDFRREFDEDEMATMVEIVFPTFVDHPKEIVFGCFVIGKDFVDLPHNQRGFVIGIVNTHSKLFSGGIHL